MFHLVTAAFSYKQRTTSTQILKSNLTISINKDKKQTNFKINEMRSKVYAIETH